MKPSDEGVVEIDDLICPITLRIFRNPVLAADGHVYERSAIVRWIMEHGTSPLTRQPLNVNELQSDDYLRNLAAQRRKSTESYDYDINIDQVVFQHRSSLVPNNSNINIVQAVPTQPQTIPHYNVITIDNTGGVNVSRRNFCQHNRCWILMEIIMVIILLIIFNSGTSSTVSYTYPPATIYSAMLTTNGQTYCRPGTAPSDYYYYHAIQIAVHTKGFFSLSSNSSINMCGYIYTPKFDPFDPCSNMRLRSDCGGDNGQFLLSGFLEPDITYILVVTTYSQNSTGVYSIITSGPGVVMFNSSSLHTISLQSIPLRGANIGVHDRWLQDGVTMAGGNGNGSRFNQLDRPDGLYVDDDLTIYVADSANHRIMEWKSNATSGQVIAGGNGQGKRDDQLNGPSDVIVDKETDTLIICDQWNRRVVRWPRRNSTRGETIISDIDCYGLTMDDDRSLYVVDRNYNRVKRWRVGEAYGTVVAGGYSRDHYNHYPLKLPTSVFVDQHHSVYVSEALNFHVTKWSNEVSNRVAGIHGVGDGLTQLIHPHGVVVDQLGTVYVADWGNDRIMRWPKRAREGSIVVGQRGTGQQPNQLRRPTGLSFDRYGNLYVVDSGNFRVQRFNRLHNC